MMWRSRSGQALGAVARAGLVTGLCGAVLFGCAGAGQLGGEEVKQEPEGELFYPWLFEQKPFDPDAVEIDGVTASEWIEKLEHDPSETGRSAAAGVLIELCFGNPLHFWRFYVPSREDTEAMIRAVEVGRTGPRPKMLVPVLARALDDPSGRVRLQIAMAFDQIGPVAAAACPALRRRLKDEVVVIRLWAARALYRVQHEVDAPLAATVAAFEDENPEVRIMALYKLVIMGPDARQAIEAVRRCLDDPEEEVRDAAEGALGALTSSR